LPIAAANAQGDIHRCVGADGRPVFTDRVCSDVNATPVLPPASAATTTPVTTVGPAQQPPPVLCAADEAHLKQAVVDAFAVHNPNRLAGLMLWDGAGQQAVVANIRTFTRLMTRPLVDVDTESASATYDEEDGDSSDMTSASTAAHGGALVVQTESDDGDGDTETTRFDIIHHAGCLWLRPEG
jgi:hypothetical protein